MNRILLDKHVFIWYATNDFRLGREPRTLIDDLHAQVFVSIVTCWEISIKLGLGKLKLEMPLEDLFAFERQAMNLLEVTLDDVSAYATLGFPVQDHRDPFDRLLAVQAQERGLKLVTADPVFSGYLPHDLLVIN